MNTELPTKNVFLLFNFNFLSTASLKFDFYKTGETMEAISMRERVHCIFMFSARGLMFDIFRMYEKRHFKIMPYIRVQFFPE